MEVEKNLPEQPDRGRIGLKPDQEGNLFFYLQLWPLIFLQPLDLQECTVPHLKDLIIVYLENESQGHGMTFNMIYDRSKYPHFISYRGLFYNRSCLHCISFRYICSGFLCVMVVKRKWNGWIRYYGKSYILQQREKEDQITLKHTDLQFKNFIQIEIFSVNSKQIPL